MLQPFAQLFSSLVLTGVAVMVQFSVAVPLGATEHAADRPIRVGIALAPKTLNPLLAADSAGARILQLTHPALLRYDANYRPIGQVASGCTQTSPQAMDCTLPPNQTFTSGAPLTAPAVVAWLQQVQATPRSPLSGQLRGVSVSALAPLVLQFTLPSPSLAFMGQLTEIPIADPANPTHGAGAYTAMQTETTGAVTLTPRVGRPLPPLMFTPLADATTRLLKLQKAELDVLVNDLPPNVVRYARQHTAAQGWQIINAPSTAYSYLALNFNNPLLAQPAVREALSLALNRPLLRRTLLEDLAQPAQSLLPLGHPAAWAAPEDPYDILSAEGLLDETTLPDGRTLMEGPAGGRLSLTLLTSTEAFAQRLAQALQAQWAAVGVEVNLENAEWASFFSRVQAGRFDMALLTWTGEQQPTFYHQLFHSGQTPPNGFNRGYVRDAELDRLLTTLVQAPNPAAQITAAIAVQQNVASLRPYLPLWRRDNVLMMRQGVTGCALSASGDYRGLTTCQSVQSR
jgi:peptide/nickel transport system substrate-binding protein